MSKELRHKEVWTGDYKGIFFEIQKFKSYSPEHDFSWTHYIYIWESQFCEDLKNHLVVQEYYTDFGTYLSGLSRNSGFNQVEFSGGITYCKIDCVIPHDRLYKIGCDYQHIWDSYSHSVGEIRANCIKTIDSLFDCYPEIKSFEQVNKEFRSKFPQKSIEGVYRYDKDGEPLNE